MDRRKLGRLFQSDGALKFKALLPISWETVATTKEETEYVLVGMTVCIALDKMDS